MASRAVESPTQLVQPVQILRAIPMRRSGLRWAARDALSRRHLVNMLLTFFNVRPRLALRERRRLPPAPSGFWHSMRQPNRWPAICDSLVLYFETGKERNEKKDSQRCNFD